MNINNILYKSAISHGGGSQRVYLMDLHPDDFPEIIGAMEQIAKENNYTKLFAKIPARYSPAFINAGYVMEAAIPSFYNGKEDALFMMRYTDPARSVPETDRINALQEMLLKPANTSTVELDKHCILRRLTEADAPIMTEVFKDVFETYPFPIFDPAFLIKAMREDDTRFFGVFRDKELIAISSAECNSAKKNAEMTDFAVLPSQRGKKLAVHLLKFMEEELTKDGFITFYTIARLHSIPMNKTFYNLGYRYAGVLTRNTQISGSIESMVVWYKHR
jgi:beta-lysine N6-acetyltransferase